MAKNQLNLSLDDELWKRLKLLSAIRGTTIQEMARSSIRGYCPETQIVKIKTQNGDIPVPAVISELHLSEGSYWIGSIKFNKTISQILELDPGFLDAEFILTTENDRVGQFKIIGFTSSIGANSILKFVGITNLSQNDR